MKVEMEIPAQRLCDILTTSIESGFSRYWCAGVYIVGQWAEQDGTPKPTSQPWWYCSPEVFAGDFTIEVHEIPDESKRHKVVKHRINAADMAKGFAVFAKKAGQSFGDFMAENEDGICADSWLQCVALGEIRYG